MKQQHITHFLLVLLLIMTGISVAAHDIEVANADGKTIYYVWTNNKTKLAVSYRGSYSSSYSGGYSGNVVIPESVTYNGANYPVTSIGGSAFFGSSGLTSVTIPNSVTSIGGSAFYGCSGLTSVTIGNSVTSIGSDAFYGTAWYNNQPNGIVYAGKVAYKYKGTMPANTNITLLDGTLGIADCAFRNCSGLTSVTIPNSVTSIGGYAFQYCSGLTSVTISDLDAWCNIRFGDSTSNPLYYAHHLYMSGEEVRILDIPNTVTRIAEYAFYNCSSLTSVTIPSSVTAIGIWSFYGCSSLTSVAIPVFLARNLARNQIDDMRSGLEKPKETLSYLRKEASKCIEQSKNSFYKRLDSIIYSIRSIEDDIYAYETLSENGEIVNFAWVSDLQKRCYDIYHDVDRIHKQFDASIRILTITASEGGMVSFDEVTVINSTKTIYWLSLDESDFISHYPYLTISPDDGYYIKSFTMDGNAEEYTIPIKTDNSWRENRNCEVTFESTFRTIHVATAGTLPDLISEADKYVIEELTLTGDLNGTDFRLLRDMAGCNYLGNETAGKLKKLDFSGARIVKGGEMYVDTNKLLGRSSSSGFHYTVENDNSVPQYVFYGCKLEDVKISESATSVDKEAFGYCRNLTCVTIPNSVTSIGSSAFCDCIGVTGVNYNATNCTSMGSSNYPVFSGCSSLTTLNLGDNVQNIPDYAFYGCSGLTSVTIPKSVTSVGNSAFSGCTSLTEVNYNATNCTSMENTVFSGCSSLTTLNIGDNVQNIPGYAFYGCSGLTSVTIPKSVTSVGNSAFSGCTSLTEVNYNATNCTSMGSSNYPVFSGCSSLITLNIGDNVQNIPDYAFYGCSGLKSVTIPNSVTSIGSVVFSGCSGLTSVTIPNSVTSIRSYAFSSCSSLTNVTISSSVTTIASNAFAGCYSIEMVKVHVIDFAAFINNEVSYLIKNAIGKPVFLFDGTGNEIRECFVPDNVTNIRRYAFYNCCDLTSVTIPNSVTSIGDYAFSNCSNLESVTLGTGLLTIGGSIFSGHTPAKVIWLTNTPPSGYSSAAGTVNYVANDQYTSLSKKTVYPFLSSLFEVGGVKYVPVSPSERTCDAIDCVYGDAAADVTIGETVTYRGIQLAVQRVHKYACYRNPYIKNVELSLNGNVENSAFQSCTALTTATLGSAVTSIGDYAFDGCASLQQIVIPNATTDLGQYAFQNCSKMTSVKMGNGVRTISSYAFAGCSSLTDMQVGDSVNVIQTYAFNNCSQLPTITIPQAVWAIDNYVFKGCSQLHNVVMDDRTVPVTTTSLGDWISTNTAHSSTSSKIYTFPVSYGSTLSFNYWVSSESGCDKLIVTLDGSTVLNKSGEQSGTYTKSFTEYGTHTLIVKYTKDGSNSNGSDQAKITNLTIPGYDGTLQLGSNGSSPLFADCSLDSVYIGRNVYYNTSSDYGYSPFYRNTSLRAVMITDKETEISPNEFYGCTGLKNVYIGDGVTTIGNWAFSGCSSLDHFAFGASVTSIGQEAFSDCTAVTLIKSHAAQPPTCGTEALDDINKWDCILEVPQGCVATYQAADQWKEFFFTQEEDVNAIFYKLTYMVDGEPYKTYNLHYGAEIAAEPEPEKEGYTFSGWSAVPATMPARDVVVKGTFTEIPVEDVSGDTTYLLAAATVETQTGGESTLTIDMQNEAAIVGFQFDLTLPEGFTLAVGDDGQPQLTLGDRITDEAQAVSVVNVGGGNTWRFVSYSLQNTAITGTSGTVLSATLMSTAAQGAYEAQITKAVLTRQDGTQLKLQDSTFSIVVCNTAKGDANGDGEVNVTDIVEMVNDIMERPSERFVEVAADMNVDGEVNVTDIVLVVNVIMGDDQVAAARSSMDRQASTADDQLTLTVGNGGALGLWLTNQAEYVAAQMDIRLSAGQTIEGVLLNSRRSADHLLTCDKISDGLYRVVVCSLTGSPLLDNSGELLSLNIGGEGTVTIEHILFVTTDADEKHFADLTAGTTTGIDTIGAQPEPMDVYTTDGRLVRRQATSLSGLQKGMYIVNGKKQVVR